MRQTVRSPRVGTVWAVYFSRDMETWSFVSEHRTEAAGMRNARRWARKNFCLTRVVAETFVYVFDDRVARGGPRP